MKLSLFNSLILLAAFALNGQERIPAVEPEAPSKVETFLKKQGRFSGSLNATGELFDSEAPTSYREPHRAYSDLNLNLGLWKFEMPLRFTLSTDEFTRSEQLKFLGIEPTYKWAKLYVLDYTLDLAPMTGSGVTLRGGGYTLTPGIITHSLFYGKIHRGTTDLLADPDDEFDPKRMVFASKIGVNIKDMIEWELSGSRVEDSNDSLFLPRSRSLALDTLPDPAQNFVVGSGLTLKLFKSRLSLKAEGALSLYNSNATTAPITLDDQPEWTTDIFQPREGSMIDYALSTEASLRLEQVQLRTFFKRYGAGFTALALASSPADQLSGGGSVLVRLPKALNSSLINSLNLRRDNLAEEKARTMKHIQYTGNLSMRPQEFLALSAGYSRNTLKNEANLDSLIFKEDTLSNKIALFNTYNDRVTLNGTLNRKSGELAMHSLSLTGAIQQSEKESKDSTESSFDTQMMIAGYNYAKSKFTGGTSYSLTRTVPVTGALYLHSGSVNVGYNPKPFWRNSGNLSVQKNDANSAVNFGVSSRYTLANRNTFSLSLHRLDLFDSRDAAKEYREIGAKLSYSLSF